MTLMERLMNHAYSIFMDKMMAYIFATVNEARSKVLGWQLSSLEEIIRYISESGFESKKLFCIKEPHGYLHEQ